MQAKRVGAVNRKSYLSVSPAPIPQGPRIRQRTESRLADFLAARCTQILELGIMTAKVGVILRRQTWVGPRQLERDLYNQNHFAVSRERFIGCEKLQGLRDGLSYEKAIKWIRVMKRQLGDACSMARAYR